MLDARYHHALFAVIDVARLLKTAWFMTAYSVPVADNALSSGSVK